jgi:hypothetical protein
LASVVASGDSVALAVAGADLPVREAGEALMETPSRPMDLTAIEREKYVAGIIPEPAFRCFCGCCWSDQPNLFGICTSCRSGIVVYDFKPTAPWYAWATYADVA